MIQNYFRLGRLFGGFVVGLIFLAHFSSCKYLVWWLHNTAGPIEADPQAEKPGQGLGQEH
jgi:hypothetical protein